MLFKLENGEVIKKDNIQELFYLTHIDNLSSILVNGILSHKRAKKNQPKHQDISNNDVQGRRSKKIIPRVNEVKKPLNLHRHVPLFLNAHNAMTSLKKSESVCILRLYSKILDRGDAVITNRNASTDKADFYTVEAFELTKESTEIIKSSEPFCLLGKKSDSEREEFKQVKQAEVLLPYHIHSKYVGGIFVPNEKIEQEVKDILETIPEKKDLHISIHPSIFFIDPKLPNKKYVYLKSFALLSQTKPLNSDFEHEYPDSSDSEDEAVTHTLIRTKKTVEIPTTPVPLPSIDTVEQFHTDPSKKKCGKRTNGEPDPELSPKNKKIKIESVESTEHTDSRNDEGKKSNFFKPDNSKENRENMEDSEKLKEVVSESVLSLTK